jgi:alkylation response protein AidB-like acyl-CoA dehydrogenase
MSELRTMIVASVRRLCERHCTAATIAAAEQGVFPTDLWKHLAEAGVFRLLAGTEDGGVGATIADTAAALSVLGGFAVPGPVVESVAANLARTAVGLAAIDAPQSLAFAAASAQGDQPATELSDVRWGKALGGIVIARRCGDGTSLSMVDPSDVRLDTVSSLSGEPMAAMTIAGPDLDQIRSSTDIATLRNIVALGRCAEAVGAIKWMLESCLRHVDERSQFGRPIGRFQAVQQMLAEMGAHVAAAGTICNAACELADDGDWTLVSPAVVRIVGAVDRSVAIAHQIHGAIGFSREHGLNLRTRRAMQWCDDAYLLHDWSAELGERLIAPEASLWEWLVPAGGDDPASLSRDWRPN